MEADGRSQFRCTADGENEGKSRYEVMKEERSQVLWELVELLIPDIRARAVWHRVGTPVTHARYLRRHRGTYGPGNLLAMDTMPKPVQPLPGMWCCGDSTFPGVGTPAAAASGMFVANSVASLADHWRAMDELQL